VGCVVGEGDGFASDLLRVGVVAYF
jgi:hypothetical protein